MIYKMFAKLSYINIYFRCIIFCVYTLLMSYVYSSCMLTSTLLAPYFWSPEGLSYTSKMTAYKLRKDLNIYKSYELESTHHHSPLKRNNNKKQMQFSVKYIHTNYVHIINLLWLFFLGEAICNCMKFSVYWYSSLSFSVSDHAINFFRPFFI